MSETETIWPLAPHTRVKHDLLRSYLNAWFPIVASKKGVSRRLLFVDGFAGPGIYRDGEPGSPIVALSAIADARLDLSHCEFLFLFVEQDEDRVESLHHQVDLFEASHDPMPNVKVRIEQGEFDTVARQILDQLDAQEKNLAPTLAMIDPFGFGGVPMSLIAEFLRFPRCEVFFNFMLDSVNRHAQNPFVDQHMENLFGTADFRKVPSAGNPKRRQFLLNLYERQLRDVAGFTYVSRFDLVNERGRPNAIFHGTRHLQGLAKMREAAWRSDPVEGRRFDARDDPNTGTLFDGQVDLDPLRDALVHRFQGEQVGLKTVQDFVLTDTPYNPSSHLKKGALKALEGEGWISDVQHPSGSVRRRGTFPDGCTIRFAD